MNNLRLDSSRHFLNTLTSILLCCLFFCAPAHAGTITPNTGFFGGLHFSALRSPTTYNIGSNAYDTIYALASDPDGYESNHTNTPNNQNWGIGATVGYSFLATQYLTLGIETGFDFANTPYQQTGNATIYDADTDEQYTNLATAKVENLYYIPLLLSANIFTTDRVGILAKAGIAYVHQQASYNQTIAQDPAVGTHNHFK